VREIQSEGKTSHGRSRGRKFGQIVYELKRYTNGWIQYYGIADMKKLVKTLNQWIRCRLRMYIWKQRKKISAKFKNLQKLGLAKQKAWEWSNTHKSYWHTAGSWILATTITNDRLERRGYSDIFKKYEAVHLRYRTAVYRTVRTVV
jgi:hypothetical protein